MTTPLERTEKIIQHIESIYGKRTGWVIDFVAAQIEEADREAIERGRLIGYKECDQIFKFSKNYKDAVAEGFSAARDKAIEAYRESGTSVEVEKRLREMKP